MNQGRPSSITPHHVSAWAARVINHATAITRRLELRLMTTWHAPMAESTSVSVALPPSRSESGPPTSLPAEKPAEPKASSEEIAAAENPSGLSLDMPKNARLIVPGPQPNIPQQDAAKRLTSVT